MNLDKRLPVEIENLGSWPKQFKNKAIKNKPILVSYHKEQFRLSRLCEEDISLRINPPKNKYSTEYQILVDSLESILMEHNIVGHHCTRLTTREIKAIRAGGLKILSSELVQQRLQFALLDGHLSQGEFSYLQSSELIKTNLSNQEGRRTGMIWFCPNRSALKDYGGVYRLFRFWGGEAIYMGHSEDERISKVLRRVGTPCIVKCAIPFGDTEQFFSNYAERFLSYLVSDVIECPEPPPAFDMYTKRDVASAELLEIIEVSNPKFEQWTGYKSWNDRYSIVNEN